MKKVFTLLLVVFIFCLTGCGNKVSLTADQQGIISYNLENKQIEMIYKTDDTNYSKASIAPNGGKFLMIKQNSIPGDSINYSVVRPDTSEAKDYTLKIPQTEGEVAPIIMNGELLTDWLDNETLCNAAFNLVFNEDSGNLALCELPRNHILAGSIQQDNEFVLVHAPQPEANSREMQYYGSWYDKGGKLLNTKDLKISGNTFMVNGSSNKMGMLLNYAKQAEDKMLLYTSYTDFANQEMTNWAKDTASVVLNPQGPLIAGIPYNPATHLLGDEEQAIIAIYDILGNKVIGFKAPKELPLILFPEWLAWSDDGTAVYALVNDYKKEHSYLLKADTGAKDKEYAEILLDLPYICSPAGMGADENLYFLINPATNNAKE